MSKDDKTKIINQGGPTGFVLFVAFFGALVYFVQQSDGFWQFLYAIVKAIVWPGILLYNVLQSLGV